MTHPEAEELTEFLYEELAPQRQLDVAEHLEVCEECRDRVAGWQTLRQELARWKFPSPARPILRRRIGWPALKTGIAAAVLLGAGFGLARATSRAPDPSRLRAELRLEIRSELEQRLKTELAVYASEESGARQQLERSVAESIGKLEARQDTEHTALRQDVETVAMRTQEEFDRIERSVAGQSAPLNP